MFTFKHKVFCTCIGHGQVNGSLQNIVSNQLLLYSVTFLNSGLNSLQWLAMTRPISQVMIHFMFPPKSVSCHVHTIRLWCSLFLGPPSSNNGPQCFKGTGDEFPKFRYLNILSISVQKASSSCLHLNQWCAYFVLLLMWNFRTYLGGCYLKQPCSNLFILFRVNPFNQEESILVKGLPSTSLIFDDVHWHIHVDLITQCVYFITPMVL